MGLPLINLRLILQTLLVQVGITWWLKSSVGNTAFFIDGVEVDDIPDHFNLEVSSVGNSFVGGYKFAPKWMIFESMIGAFQKKKLVPCMVMEMVTLEYIHMVNFRHV